MNKPLLSLLLSLSPAALAQRTTNDNNFQKAYEVLELEKDQSKDLDFVNKQLRETLDNVDALLFRVQLLRNKEDLKTLLNVLTKSQNYARRLPYSSARAQWSASAQSPSTTRTIN